LLTVINRPLGHRLTDAELAASVTDSSGEALFTTAFSHGLVAGDYVYVISNFDAYNGFKYVYSPTYNTFKLRDYETGDVVPYYQDTDLFYRISVLQHGWSAVNQPIVYELESDLFPNNVDEEAYTPNIVVSQADAEGYTLLNLSAALSDPTALSWVELVGSGSLAGQYQIITVLQPWQIIINLDYDASNSFGGYLVVKYYKNYCINVQVWSGVGAEHPWFAEKPYELAATLQYVPDENGRAKFSIAEILRGYLIYLNYKKQIAETYQESKDWGVVFSTSVYSDVKEAQESFIDYVEETYQTKVKDGKHLQKLTGITHLDSWDSKAGKYITPDTEEEAKENAIRELEETVINSRYSKYFRALEKALQEGVKYKDLLQIKPQDFGLPKNWSGCLGSDQYSSILWALSFEFLINEPASLMLLPDLRSIAQEIQAPYSVLMDCYNLTNKGKKYGATGD